MVTRAIVLLLCWVAVDVCIQVALNRFLRYTVQCIPSFFFSGATAHSDSSWQWS